MVFVTITKEAPRRGLQSQPLPTPKANGPCPTIRVPALNAGLVPGGATAPMPATWWSWAGCKCNAGSARPVWAAPRPCRRV